MECEIDRQLGVVPAVMCVLPLVRRELSIKVKLLICWLIYFPTLTYGQELEVVTKRTRP